MVSFFLDLAKLGDQKLGSVSLFFLGTFVVVRLCHSLVGFHQLTLGRFERLLKGVTLFFHLNLVSFRLFLEVEVLSEQCSPLALAFVLGCLVNRKGFVERYKLLGLFLDYLKKVLVCKVCPEVGLKIFESVMASRKVLSEDITLLLQSLADCCQVLSP